MSRTDFSFAPSALVFLLTMLAGCTMVGPDFSKPAAPGVNQYTENTQPTTVTDHDVTQTFSRDQDIQADWWKLFHSTALNELIEVGLKNNPSVAAAEAALVNARESVSAQRDNLFIPAINAQAGEIRQRLSPEAFGFPGNPSTFSLTNASVQVSYTLDFFGANRRQIESMEAQVEAERYLLQAARVTLAANIVTTAIREASLRDQLHASETVEQLESKTLGILEIRERLGAVSQTEVQLQRASLAQARAIVPGLQKQLAQTRHQLAVYVGKFPGETGLPHFQLKDLTLPQKLPVSVPSALVHQRPDILISEAQLHQATANLGLTIAGAYPNVTLSASFGAIATRPGDLFNTGSSIWSLGGSLVQPLFHGGALEAEQRAAQAALDQAAAQYRQTVLNAFQNVADVLRALESDASTLAAQSDASGASLRSLSLAQAQYASGGISFLALMNAEERQNQTQLALIQAQAARLADSAALFLAMGGGWWNDGRVAP
ncbi:MAG: efflux transporter outer membrane subunit [Betaproteobacteria bacterium]|nr:efflux transporter outer membrane subunit [Betaproteobacteria bacterium]